MDASGVTQQPRTRPGRRGSVGLFLVGMVGVLAAVPLVMGLVDDLLTTMPDIPELPYAVLVALALVNPLLLLALGTLAGATLAHRVGLRSRLAERLGGAPVAWTEVCTGWRLGIAVGIGVGVALVVLDALTLPLLGPEGAALAVLEDRGVLLTVAGVLYGGVTEEIMLRWGLMSLLAWLGWRLTGAATTGPATAVMWVAIVLTAVTFGALHLPTVGAITSVTVAVALRTVLLNALGGVAFGWLFWRRGLEAAMIAHAVAHLAMTAVAIVVGG